MNRLDNLRHAGNVDELATSDTDVHTTELSPSTFIIILSNSSWKLIKYSYRLLYLANRCSLIQHVLA